MTFNEEVESGWQEPARGDQTNMWSDEVKRCGNGLERMRDQIPPDAIGFLHDLFFEIGRLCRDAEAQHDP